MKTFFLVQTFYKSMGYLASIMFRIPRQYFHLVSITEDPRYNVSVCCQRFCCKIEFAVIKKLDRDSSKA